MKESKRKRTWRENSNTLKTTEAFLEESLWDAREGRSDCKVSLKTEGEIHCYGLSLNEFPEAKRTNLQKDG